MGGQFLAVLTGCARGLKIPLTADSRFPPNSFFEKTQLLLVWELGVHLKSVLWLYSTELKRTALCRNASAAPIQMGTYLELAFNLMGINRHL